MEANSGRDPYGSYREFMKKDIQKPLHQRKALGEYENKTGNHFQTQQKSWAVGTTKFSKKIAKADGTITRDFKPVAKHHIKTDYISVDPPASERPFQKMFD